MHALKVCSRSELLRENGWFSLSSESRRGLRGGGDSSRGEVWAPLMDDSEKRKGMCRSRSDLSLGEKVTAWRRERRMMKV